MPTLNGVLVLSGGSTSNCHRKLRWTVITNVVFAYSTAQNAFCCLVGAILKILFPRERRVFQSKLEVSSSNQCNLHHSPHTGHLEKKIKEGYNLFRTPCIRESLFSIEVCICLCRILANCVRSSLKTAAYLLLRHSKQTLYSFFWYCPYDFDLITVNNIRIAVWMTTLIGGLGAVAGAMQTPGYAG
jgi:hypothetical protein